MKLIKDGTFLLKHKIDMGKRLPIRPWFYTNFGDHFSLFFPPPRWKVLRRLYSVLFFEGKLK